MNNQYNIQQDVKEKLLLKIIKISDNDLKLKISNEVPGKFNQDIKLLRNEIKKYLQNNNFTPLWMYKILMNFAEFEGEKSKFETYKPYLSDGSYQLNKNNISKFFEVNNPFLLLIDGNNLIHEIFDSPFHDINFPKWLTWDKAEELLFKKTDQFLQYYPFSSGRIYRDHSQYSDVPSSKRLRIIYSGGGDATDRADKVILQDLNYKNSTIKRILVTADRDLVKQAKLLSTITISPHIYLDLLKNLNTNNLN